MSGLCALELGINRSLSIVRPANCHCLPMKDKRQRSHRSSVNAMNLPQNSQYSETIFFFRKRKSSFAAKNTKRSHSRLEKNIKVAEHSFGSHGKRKIAAYKLKLVK